METPTQHAIAAAHAAWLKAAESPDMWPRREAQRSLDQARREAWRAGECCGDRGDGGTCKCVLVRFARQEKLQAAGMGRAARLVIGGVCEHSETWQLIQVAADACRDEGIEGVTLARLADAVIEEVQRG